MSESFLFAHNKHHNVANICSAHERHINTEYRRPDPATGKPSVHRPLCSPSLHNFFFFCSVSYFRRLYFCALVRARRNLKWVLPGQCKQTVRTRKTIPPMSQRRRRALRKPESLVLQSSRRLINRKRWCARTCTSEFLPVLCFWHLIMLYFSIERGRVGFFSAQHRPLIIVCFCYSLDLQTAFVVFLFQIWDSMNKGSKDSTPPYGV